MTEKKVAKVKAPKTEKIVKEKKNPKGTAIRKEFEFTLTEKECNAIYRKAVEFELEASKFGLQFEEAKDNFKAKIQAALSKAMDLRKKAYDAKEIRALDAILVKDYDAKEIKYYFKGKIVEARTMTAEECQVHMDELNPKKKVKTAEVAITVKGKVLKARDASKSIAAVSGKKAKDSGIADVIRMETSRKTKTSSVDGATRT